MLVTVLPFGGEKGFEVANAHAVPVDENPLRENVHLRGVLLEIDTAFAQVIEQGVKPIEWQFADLLWLTQGWACGLLEYDEVVSLLLEDLQHLRGDLRFGHELQIAIG